MTENKRDTATDEPLNPALKSTRETVYNTSSTPPPLGTTGAKENQGEGWPIIWLVVVLLCLAITVYLIFF